MRRRAPPVGKILPPAAPERESLFGRYTTAIALSGLAASLLVLAGVIALR